jgi:hypothetical protein
MSSALLIPAGSRSASGTNSAFQEDPHFDLLPQGDGAGGFEVSYDVSVAREKPKILLLLEKSLHRVMELLGMSGEQDG